MTAASPLPTLASGLSVLVVSSVPLAAPWNGADKNVARALVTAGDDHRHVVVTSARESWDKWPHVTPVRHRWATSQPTRRQRLVLYAAARRYARDADVVHVVASLRAPQSAESVLVRRLLRRLGRPILHTCPSVGDGSLQRTWFFGDTTVVFSEHTAQRLEEVGVPNVVRLDPPLDLARLQGANPERARRRYGLSDATVLYPAHHGDANGVPEIVSAFAALGRDIADARLVLALRDHPWQDAAGERRRVEELCRVAGIADRTTILGSVESMPDLIAACAVTALVPASLESKMDLPMALLEAQALGRPVVASDRAPVREAVARGGGVTVPSGNVGALRSALALLLSDPPLRDRLGATARDVILERCDPAVAAGVVGGLLTGLGAVGRRRV